MRAAITGAFGYTGRHVAARLLARGDSVVTLTNHPRGAEIAGRPVDVHPLDFGDPADGRYGIQPVFIEDYASLLVEAADATGDSIALDAVGPDVFAFRELVRTIGRAVGARSAVVGLPPALALAGTRLLGLLVRDVVLTPSEVRDLMDG